MATQSTANPVEDKPENSDSKQEIAAPAIERSPPSVFVNSEPIREDQVQNAVKFLSHPRVKGSPVMYRRSFLEKKGLSREEIDEAFRRVPDELPAATTVQPATTTQGGQLTTPTTFQTPPASQILQPAAPVGVASKGGLLTKFGWSHAFLAIGLLAASGAGTALLLKKSIIPRLKSWIREVVAEEDDNKNKLNSKPTLAEEAASAAKAAAAAASDVAKISQELMNSKHEERKYFEDVTSLLGVQVQEMKSMSNSIRKLEGKNYTYVDEDDYRVNSKKPYTNGKVDVDVRSVRSPPTSVDNSAPPHPKSYMEIMSMIQRGEKPANIREINDLPPNPNQQISNPRLAPLAKPWETTQGQQSSIQTFSGDEGYGQLDGYNTQVNGNGSATWRQPRNSRVTEIENEDESRTGSVVNDRPPPRRWVPPQPPPVVMPEAAEAIRRPKSIRSEPQSTDNDQLSVQSSEGVDELQRITKISELGGEGVSTTMGAAQSYNEKTEEQQEWYSHPEGN